MQMHIFRTLFLKNISGLLPLVILLLYSISYNYFFFFSLNDKLNTVLRCLNKKCEVINREINALGVKQQVGKEETESSLNYMRLA